MDKKYTEAFTAVLSFVDDLWSVFGSDESKTKKKSPLYLYKYLVEKITFKDTNGINTVLNSFKAFFAVHEDSIMNDNLQNIPRDTVIRYGESPRVYLEIQKYIYQTQKDKPTQEAIRQHLITISSILEPNKKKLAELDKSLHAISNNSNEGQFISDIMGRAQSKVNNLGDIDMNNPASAVMGLFQSGIITDMVAGMQEGVASGRMDPKKLMSTMQSMMSSMSLGSDDDSSGNNREITDEK